VKYLKNYIIPFSGLKEGKHQFQFEAGERFFREFEESEIERGEVNIEVELEKRTTYLSLGFKLTGSVQLICDRCLDNYDQPLDNDFKLYVKFSEEPQVDDDEVMYLHPNDHQVEVGHLIYEFIVLSLPARHVHPDDENGESTCDPDMLDKLDEYDHPGDDDEPIDPRWNDLKKIIGN
jgi:uncharacterized metal-binding protein YceD (DUF177 family)